MLNNNVYSTAAFNIFDSSSSISEHDYDQVRIIIGNIIDEKFYMCEDSNDQQRSTIDSLIDQLLMCIDNDFVDTFLITFRLFSSSNEVLNKILSCLAKSLDYCDNLHRVIKVRSYAVMKRWITGWGHLDFDANLHDEYLNILNSLRPSCKDESDDYLVRSMMNLCKQQESEKASMSSQSSRLSRIKSLFSRSVSSESRSQSHQDSFSSLDSIYSALQSAHLLLSQNTDDIAQVLFQLEVSHLKRVDWRELVAFPEKDLLTVQIYIDHFNNVYIRHNHD